VSVIYSERVCNDVDGLAHYGVYQSPCTDHCQELRQREEELVAMRLRGLALRRDYLKAGFDNGNNEQVCLLVSNSFIQSVFQCTKSSYYKQLNVTYQLFQCILDILFMWCAELYCHPPRPQAADGGAASRYRG